MTNNSETREEARNEIEDLLPWHAAGTLNRRDTRRVEDALRRDPELARRYELVREELAQTIHLNETLGAPSARAMEKLFARIDAEPKRMRAPSLHIGARVSEFFANLSPRTLAWSATAAVVAILLQASVITGVMLDGTQSTNFKSASAPTESRSATAGTVVSISFKPEATAADITKFLATNKLKIVSGPSASGLYRVQIAAAGLPKDELARFIKRLQENAVVGIIASE